MSDTLRIGMIGLDTSHVTAFTQLLNDPAAPHHVGGGRVVVAFPGGSKDFDLSINRVEGFTRDMREKHGVKIVDSPEAVAEQSDLVFLESVDGRVHLAQFKKILPFKRPTFIDKPLATKFDEAQDIFCLAKDAGIPIMSSGSIRFADNLVAALAESTAENPVTGCDIFGPMNWQPTQPGWFWYGIHHVEALVTVMNAAIPAGTQNRCRTLRVTANEKTDEMVATWSDGRIATVRGMRYECHKFGLTLHRKKDFQFINPDANPRPVYASLVDAIMRSLPKGVSAIPAEQTLEVIRILEAANRSRETGEEITL